MRLSGDCDCLPNTAAETRALAVLQHADHWQIIALTIAMTTV